MDGDKSGESGVFLFSRDASQISAMVGDHSRQIKTQICTVGDVGDGFRSLPIPYKLLGSSPPITQVSIFGALSISGQIHRENLSLTCGDYPIYLGRSAKSKIPDRLGFSRHMKPGFISRPSLILNNKKLNTVICVLILVGSIKFLDLTFHRASWCRSLFFNKL